MLSYCIIYVLCERELVLNIRILCCDQPNLFLLMDGRRLGFVLRVLFVLFNLNCLFQSGS